MDDTQQSTQPIMNQQPNSGASTMGDIAGMQVPPAPAMPGGMGMGDQSVQGMTPPPAMPTVPTAPIPEFVPGVPAAPAMPVAPDSTVPADSAFVSPTMPGGMQSVNDVTMTPPSAPTLPTKPASDTTAASHEQIHNAGNADDYSYAEDILNEILDSLDRIEAKLEALEKKQG